MDKLHGFLLRLKPPCGPEVRRFVGLVTLVTGFPRLPLLSEVLPFAPLRFASPEAWGVILTALGIALIATSGRHRLRVRGRIVAALAVVAWATLAAAATSTTSILINLLCAASMLAEVWTVAGDGDY